jgi:hypothetical protein
MHLALSSCILSNNSIMQNPTLALQIQTLPDSPGVYQYYDKDGKILYGES